jgi:hypothetical protein
MNESMLYHRYLAALCRIFGSRACSMSNSHKTDIKEQRRLGDEDEPAGKARRKTLASLIRLRIRSQSAGTFALCLLFGLAHHHVLMQSGCED